MVTDRKICGFNKQVKTMNFGMPEPPEGGLCLSAFSVITDERNANSVLMGRLNPKAPWDHIVALDASRVEVHSKGWMLSSSHLLVYESRQDSAKRNAIARSHEDILEYAGLVFKNPYRGHNPTRR